MAVECRRHAGGTQKITSISMLSTSRSIAAMTRWRVSMGKGKKGTRKMSDTTPRRISCESQQLEAHNEITYVPTSALKSAMAEDQKNGPGRGTLDEDKSIEELDEEDIEKEAHREQTEVSGEPLSGAARAKAWQRIPQSGLQSRQNHQPAGRKRGLPVIPLVGATYVS